MTLNKNLPEFIKRHKVLSWMITALIVISITGGTLYYANQKSQSMAGATLKDANKAQDYYQKALENIQGFKELSASPVSDEDDKTINVTLTVESLTPELLNNISDALGQESKKYTTLFLIKDASGNSKITFTEKQLFEAPLLIDTYTHVFTQSIQPDKLSLYLDQVSTGDTPDQYQISLLFTRDSYQQARGTFPELLKWLIEQNYSSVVLGMTDASKTVNLTVSTPRSADQVDLTMSLLDYFSGLSQSISTWGDTQSQIQGNASLDGTIYFGVYPFDPQSDTTNLKNKLRQAAEADNHNGYTINFYE